MNNHTKAQAPPKVHTCLRMRYFLRGLVYSHCLMDDEKVNFFMLFEATVYSMG